MNVTEKIEYYVNDIVWIATIYYYPQMSRWSIWERNINNGIDVFVFGSPPRPPLGLLSYSEFIFKKLA
jgi:hypothetical protein